MNWDVVKGKWKQLKGSAQVAWGDLSDDDWRQAAGDRERLVGKLQERYGWAKDRAERKVDRWADGHVPE